MAILVINRDVHVLWTLNTSRHAFLYHSMSFLWKCWYTSCSLHRCEKCSGEPKFITEKVCAVHRNRVLLENNLQNDCVLWSHHTKVQNITNEFFDPELISHQYDSTFWQYHIRRTNIHGKNLHQNRTTRILLACSSEFNCIAHFTWISESPMRRVHYKYSSHLRNFISTHLAHDVLS